MARQGWQLQLVWGDSVTSLSRPHQLPKTLVSSAVECWTHLYPSAEESGQDVMGLESALPSVLGSESEPERRIAAVVAAVVGSEVTKRRGIHQVF